MTSHEKRAFCVNKAWQMGQASENGLICVPSIMNAHLTQPDIQNILVLKFQFWAWAYSIKLLTTVVYFDQQVHVLHAICMQKSTFSALGKPCCTLVCHLLQDLKVPGSNLNNDFQLLSLYPLWLEWPEWSKCSLTSIQRNFSVNRKDLWA